MSDANPLEIRMLELINQERSAIGADPLTFNSALNQSSEDHSEWMLEEDVFQHQGVNGSSSQERMQDAGYPFEGAWASGENIAFQSIRGAPGLEDDVVDLHTSLMNSPGHRANILNPDFTEIGIGLEDGVFTSDGTDFDSLMVTQNFATTDAVPVPPVAEPEPDVVSAQPDEAVDDPEPTDVPEVVPDAGSAPETDEDTVPESPVQMADTPDTPDAEVPVEPVALDADVDVCEAPAMLTPDMRLEEDNPAADVDTFVFTFEAVDTPAEFFDVIANFLTVFLETAFEKLETSSPTGMEVPFEDGPLDLGEWSITIG